MNSFKGVLTEITGHSRKEIWSGRAQTRGRGREGFRMQTTRHLCETITDYNTRGTKKVQKARARGNQKAMKADGYTKRERGEKFMTVKNLQF